MTVKELITLHEGIRLKPYKCTAGRTTIGVGRNLDDKGITYAEADYLLDNDIAECEADLMTLPWFSELDEVRKAVLIDMRFNLGATGLRSLTSLMQAMAEEDHVYAAARMLQFLWAEQVGKRAERLALMMATGEWP